MTEGISKALLDTTSEIVILFDSGGNILYGNNSALAKLNYTDEELKGCHISKLFSQEFQHAQGAAGFDVTALSSKEETVIYQKRSSCFPVSIKVSRADDGSYLLLAEDISLKKDMDARIQQLREDEQANTKIRNEFTANVTHELRTPVNGIRGHVTTMMENSTDPEQKKTLSIILYCCDNMSSIINEILDFSKLEAGKFQLEEIEFDFYTMMEQVIATHTAEIKKKELGLNVYIDENIPQFLVGDSLRIGQILNNLLSNAIKFTKVGKIGVEVSKTGQRGDTVELFFMVRDSGIGISKEDQEKLFQSYRQVDASVTRRFGGTGLGLAITKQLVEEMGGMIRVDSEKGKGSCFSFSIRLGAGASQADDSEVQKTIRKWNEQMSDEDDEAQAELYHFGSKENCREIRRRMEKLMLSVELDSWDKAELLADTIKSLMDENDPDLKRLILRLEMSIRKENYDKSMEAYEKLRAALADKIGL